MATVFQRPMSVLSETQSPQLIPQRRQRDPIEIIDVDSLDDLAYQNHRATSPSPSRPSQRRRLSAPSEIISLLDSDEEEHIVSSSSSVRPASRTRLQSPPPPNQPWLYVPPVPPVPPRYAGHASLPMRRQPPPFPSPPVVRPSDQPFPFEANMRRQAPNVGPSDRSIRLRRGDNILPPRPFQAAPSSHHVPSMGLGGALIAQNRERHRLHQIHEASPLLDRVANTVGNGIRRILGGPAAGPRNALNFLALGNNFGFLDEDVDDPDQMLAFLVGEGPRDLDPTFNPAHAYIQSEVQRHRNRDRSPYQPEYTHPHSPETGFTHDFAPKPPLEVIDVTSPNWRKGRVLSPEPIIIDDMDGPAIPYTTSSTSSMAQAGSVLPASQTSNTMLVCSRCLSPLILSNNLTSEEHRNRRIWGLRCGHLIDGQCLKEIGQPPEEVSADMVVIDKKGKGKAKATVDDPDTDDPDHLHLHTSEHAPDDESESNIRSRLRPRQINGTFAAPSSSVQLSDPPVPAPRRRGGNAKKQPPVPVPEYMWYCPVSGCGKIHVSIKINGNWVPEKEDEDYSETYSTSSSSRGRRRGRGKGRLVAGGVNLSMEGGEGPRGVIPLFL